VNKDEYPAGTVEVRGQQIPVRVDDRGWWIADWDGSPQHSETKEGLRSKLQTLSKRKAVRVEVPFTTLRYGHVGGPRVCHGNAVGLHAGNGNLLIEWRDGTKEQDTRRSSRETLRRLTNEEGKEWLDLTEKRRDAVNALENFEKPRRVDLRTATEKAIAEAARELD